MPIDPSDLEMAYRAEYHQDSKLIDRKRIACATCGNSLSAKIREPGCVFIHPLMDTLQCTKCHDFYGNGDFSIDEDGTDKYCRMCGNGGELYICGGESCPFGFCHKCITRYIGENSSEVEADDWKCLHCNCKPLWEVRAVCAVIVLERSRKSRKHRKETTRSELYDSDDDSAQSEDSDKDSQNSKPRRSRYRQNSANRKIDSRIRRRTRHRSEDSHDFYDSIRHRENSNAANRYKESSATQEYLQKKRLAEPSRQKKRLRIQSESSEDEPFYSEEKSIRCRIRTSTKFVDQFTGVESQPINKLNNGNSSHSIKRRKKRLSSVPKNRTKLKSLESSEELTNDSDSKSSHESANDFVRNKKKKKKNFKPKEEKFENKDPTTQKARLDRAESSNSKADVSHSTTRIEKVVKDRRTPELSLESKRTRQESSTHSCKDSSTEIMKKKIRRNRSNNSESRERHDGLEKGVYSNTPDTLRKTRISEQLTDSENEDNTIQKNGPTRAKVLRSSNVDRKSEKAQQTKSLSTKPQYRTSLSSSSAEYGNHLLEKRKASIKHCLTKFASIKDNVTEDQARVIRKHADNLIRELKMLREGSSAGAEKTIQKHLTNNETSVAAISKMVQTCALLLVRCKEKWVRIERDFIKSYEDWCQSVKIESIFSDIDNSDIATSSEAEPTGQENTADTSSRDAMAQDSKAVKTPDNSTRNSDASDDDEKCKIANRLTCNSSGLTSKTTKLHSAVKERSATTRKSSGNVKSPQMFKRYTRALANRDSDGDSITSRDDELSECDSKEIFSEDENRGQSDIANKPVNEDISGKSSSANKSNNESITADSDEHEKVDGDNLGTTIEESVRSGNIKEHGSNLPDNDKQDENTNQLNSSQDVSDYDPNEVSKNSSKSDRSVINASTSMGNNSVMDESALPGTDMAVKDNGKDLNNTEMADLSQSTNADGHVGDPSDSDTATIFNHSKSDDPTTYCEANNSSKDKSEESEYLSAVETESNRIPLQNDITVRDEELISAKDTFPLAKLISKLHEETTDLDSDISLEESHASQACKERQKNDKVILHSTTLVSDDEENNSSGSIGSVGRNREVETQKKQTAAVDSGSHFNPKEAKDRRICTSDSEEAIKKKILESTSESSDDSSEVPFQSDSFRLKVTSDSEEYITKPTPTDPSTTVITSKISNGCKKSQDLEIRGKKVKVNSAVSGSVEDGVYDDVSARNNQAKQRLLSSDSESSDSDEMTSIRFPNLDSPESNSNNEMSLRSISDMESTNLLSSKSSKKKFNLERNRYYKTDEKLQMDCKVILRRLDERVLEPFRQLLSKSRERQERDSFRSLVDLDNIKKRKKGTNESKQSGSGSESSMSETSSKGHTKKKQCKKVQEKEETLLDHFEKMKNGDNYCNLSGNETDEEDILKNVLPGAEAENEIITHANQMAKDNLIQSSDSENDMQTSTVNEEEQEQESEPKCKVTKEKKKKTDIPNEEAVAEESNRDNGSNTEKENDETTNIEAETDPKESDGSDSERTREKKRMKQGLAARNWRLTDSDSSSQERKWNKSQESKGEEKSIEPTEKASKNKKKVKRRVLGSDSDSVKLTDLSDESAAEDENTDKKKSSDSENSSEIFENLRKKKRRKRNAGQNSETPSESEQDTKAAKQKRKRIKKMESDSDSNSDSDNPNNSQDTPGKLHRKNIRKVLKDKQVADVTKIAGKEEEERLRRIAERQKLYNEMYEMKLATEAKVDKLILDFDEETKKELISVHEGLVKRLKPHQAQGIKFMWDACFESLERIKSTQGSGCIVAHCMGLGKTFQVVTLAHTLLTHAETGVKTIMVVCPLSTVLNWVNEFKKWLGDINNDEDVEVFEMTKMKKNIERKYQLERWHRAGGVMILGYEMFRLLSNQKGKKMRKGLHESILKCLVNPGPDMIVCDEGHLLKNEDTALSKAMRQVKTMRRVVLTGTPLQNNLVEYHCMVQFVKPNLLGTKKEFLNRFVNPITNGQFGDSTEYDVKLMKKRAHVLHKMLEGSVQRFDYSVLTPFLPPKQEYVITVRLADIQIKLYQYYLDNLAKRKAGAGTSLFADFQSLQRIWTHPIVLRMNAEKMEKANEKKRMDMDTSDTEGSLKDFLDDGSSDKSSTSEDSDIQSTDGSSNDKPSKPRRGTRANPVDAATFKLEDEEVPQAGEWWSQFIEPEHFEDLRISSKLVLLFAILKEAEQIGDKVLVFSQSLYALSLIEEFLYKIDDETQRGTCNELLDNHSGSWSLGLDYFRLDGQTAPENRSQYCKIFNNPKNSRARLFLISTRAGGLGINLTAANRVIIFDASWNPSHDVQSIFRIYRFGQKKPCYVYRFLAQGTMEEKIYNRQVTKLSLSCRVVDEQQIDRHYSNHDLAELYQFDPNTSTDKPTLNLPKDRLLAEIFRKYEDRIETFHEHDSLLENKAEEELDEEERKEAWKEYEDERTGRRTYMNNFPNQNFAMQQYNDMLNMNQADIVNRALLSGINIETLQNLIRKDYPNSTPEQQKNMTQRAILDMYTYMETESIRQQQMAAANSFTYPTVSNVGGAGFTEQSAVGQRQYALQQQQLHQIMVQRDAQANYAKRFGNVRGPALSTAPARQQPQVVQIDDNDVIEVPVTSSAAATPAPSSSVQTPAVPGPGGNSKRQEE